MSNNYSEIKRGFVQYLIKQERRKKGTEEVDIDEENVDIFSHFAEFRRYLVFHGVADLSLFTKSLEEIKQMQFVDGKLVDADSQGDSDGAQGNDFMTDLLNDLFSEDKMIDSLDSDKSGDLDIDEVTNFLSGIFDENDDNADNTITLNKLKEPMLRMYYLDTIYEDEDSIKYLDVNHDNIIDDEERAKFEEFLQDSDGKISLKDVKNAYESIKKDKFNQDDYAYFLTDGKEALEARKQGATPQDSISSSATGGGGGYYPTTTSPTVSSVPKSTNSTPKQDPLEGLSYDELSVKRAEVQKDIDNLNGELTALLSSDDSVLDDEKQKTDDAQSAYLALLENDTKNSARYQEYKRTLSDINITQTQIDETQKSILLLDTTINAYKGEISALNTSLESYSNVYNALPKKGDSDYPENTSDAEKLEEQRMSLEKQIESINQSIDKINKYFEEKNSDGRTPREELDYLKNTELPDLEQSLSELMTNKNEFENGNEEQGIPSLMDGCSDDLKNAYKQYCEAQNAYETYKSQYASSKEEKIKEIQSSIQTKQKELNEIDAKMASLQTYNSLFDPDIKLESCYVDNGETLPYMIIYPKDYDPNKEYPAIVYLHGDYQRQYTGGGIMDETMQSVFMNDSYGLENFNGIVIIPHNTTSSQWCSEKGLTMVDDVITNVEQGGIKLDQSKIALAGGSWGGMGAEYFAAHFNDASLSHRICKVAAISSYNIGIDVNNTTTPLRGYIGSTSQGECTTSSAYMHKYYSSDKLFDMPNSGHSNSPECAFAMDDDHNGRSDLIEWFFDGKNY